MWTQVYGWGLTLTVGILVWLTKVAAPCIDRVLWVVWPASGWKCSRPVIPLKPSDSLATRILVWIGNSRGDSIRCPSRSHALSNYLPNFVLTSSRISSMLCSCIAWLGMLSSIFWLRESLWAAWDFHTLSGTNLESLSLISTYEKWSWSARISYPSTRIKIWRFW